LQSAREPHSGFLPLKRSQTEERRPAPRQAAGIAGKVGNHTFRATGVTACLNNGRTLDKAAQMANHASIRTTQLYDTRAEELTLDEVERIGV
jgi:integrase